MVRHKAGKNFPYSLFVNRTLSGLNDGFQVRFPAGKTSEDYII
jgi:hypothetical protein